jgi:uncharacterized oxidoreductase
MADIVVKHEKLRAGVEALLKTTGSDVGEARIVADHLVEANLKGHDSHGVGMIPMYVRHIKDGKLKLNRHLKLVRDDGPFLVGDGQMGHGQVVAMELTELAIARAKAAGICAAGLVTAHHIGRVGTYGERCAAANMVSLHFVNVAGHRALVAPFRGTDARFNTNPICLTLPATGANPPTILDFATSKIALGKVRVAKNKGETVAPGTLLDPKGKPTTDPNVMFFDPPAPTGAVVTFGEHKGYGLALFAEIFGAALIGGLAVAAPAHARRRQQHARDRHRPGAPDRHDAAQSRDRRRGRLFQGLAAGRAGPARAGAGRSRAHQPRGAHGARHSHRRHHLGRAPERRRPGRPRRSEVRGLDALGVTRRCGAR